MILSYQGKEYFGKNTREVFEKLWADRKDLPIYSSNEQEFIANMIEAIAMHVLVRKSATIINRQIKQNRGWTEEEIRTIDNNIDEIYRFINTLRTKGFLRDPFLFAYGKITSMMHFIKLETEEQNQLEDAVAELKQILPPLLASVEQ